MENKVTERVYINIKGFKLFCGQCYKYSYKLLKIPGKGAILWSTLTVTAMFRMSSE